MTGKVKQTYLASLKLTEGRQSGFHLQLMDFSADDSDANKNINKSSNIRKPEASLTSRTKSKSFIIIPENTTGFYDLFRTSTGCLLITYHPLDPKRPTQGFCHCVTIAPARHSWSWKSQKAGSPCLRHLQS